MKLRSSLVAVVAVLLTASPAARACINPNPPRFVSHRVPAGPTYDVKAIPENAGVASTVGSRLALTDPWSEWQTRFAMGAGASVRPPLTAGAYPVLVVDNLPNEVDGQQDAICGHPGTTAIQVNSHVDNDRINEVIAHELFHTFQAAVGGTAENWWIEATAEWGQTLLWGYTPQSPLRDTRFFAHPEASIADLGSLEHPNSQPYGGWRFVQWTQLHPFARNEPGLWRMLVGTFRRMHGATATATALRRGWPGFAQALGRFWFDHLEATLDNGGAAHAAAWTVGASGHDQTFRMRPFSARLVKIGVRSSVRRVTVRIHALGGEHQLWLRDGAQHRVTSRTYERTWCASELPANLALADTNTSTRAARLRVQVIPRSGTGCSPPPPTTCSRAAGHVAQTCTPPAATGASCDSARAGVYRNEAPDQYGFYTPPYVTFDLICAPDGLELNGFGGLLSDDNCHNVNLGPSGGSQRVGRMLNPDGSVDFSYTYSDHQVTGHLQAAGEGAQGTVSVTTPSCHIDYAFGAVWYE